MEDFITRLWRESQPEFIGWDKYLRHEFDKGYINTLSEFLKKENEAGQKIFPDQENWFAAFRETPFEKVNVVILGQDPYFNPGQAQGLSFSVPEGEPVPSSLRNIYKELGSDKDVAFSNPGHGCLESWAEQGVLLLNTVLTVRAGEPNSHKGKPSKPRWEAFTTAALRALEQHGNNIVYLAWGKSAEKTLQHAGITADKYGNNNEGKHRLFIASHPSGLSAYRTDAPFLDNKKSGKEGCRHFSKANNYLAFHKRTLIDWQT